MNIFTVPAVLTVDNSVVDLETIEALFENVSMKERSVCCNKIKSLKLSYSFNENRKVVLFLLQQFVINVSCFFDVCFFLEGHQWWVGHDNETLWECKGRWSQTAGQTRTVRYFLNTFINHDKLACISKIN